MDFSYLWEFSSALELFLNILELVALVASVVTFLVLMFNKFSKALRVILGPCGMGFWARIRTLFICRKSAVSKRAFIEFALLKTQGYGTISSTWHSIINEYKAIYLSEQNGYVYTIPNCTALIGQDFSDGVERYFAYMGKANVKKAFGIQNDKIEWVIKIHIEEAYVTPTCLLTGLLSKYEENWEEFIKRFVSTAYITESEENISNGILSSELYLTFAWLLWGPSYELEYKKYWAGLCQISYGDESNSIPVIANKDSNIIDRLRDKFAENADRRYGALVSADISLFEKKHYYREIRDFANPDNAYFYDKIENGEFSFAAQINEFTPCTNYKSKKYYCTAYVWLLFEVEDEDYAFHPEKSLAFFEHANLTDKNSYNFLIETLIDKSIKHFQKIFANEKLNGRKYRFVCGLNDKIERACQERYLEIANSDTDFGNELKLRVNMIPKRDAASAFMAYDEFFTSNQLVSFENVNSQEKNTIVELGQFYTDIYMECFPDANEREPFDNLLYYLNKKDNNPNYKYHIVLAKDNNDEIIGGCIFDFYAASNSGVIEFLAVKKDLQSAGIGSLIYNHVLSVLSEDAYKANKKPLSCVFCEIDSPQYSKADVKKYLYFWNKNGYKRLDFQYIQPSLSQTQAPVFGLWLTVVPLTVREKYLSKEMVLSVISDYMKYGMEIDNPEENKEYLVMKKELASKPQISMLDILTNQ